MAIVSIVTVHHWGLAIFDTSECRGVGWCGMARCGACRIKGKCGEGGRNERRSSCLLFKWKTNAGRVRSKKKRVCKLNAGIVFVTEIGRAK